MQGVQAQKVAEDWEDWEDIYTMRAHARA